MKQIKEKHSLAMRWCHWVNFPILIIMIWSGMLIYWANDEYKITLLGHTCFKFFPEGFYKTFNLVHRLPEGMAFHFLFMWFFILNGIFYVGYTLVSGEWRELVPQKNHLKKPGWFYCMICISAKWHHLKKYNAAQRIAYTAIIIMGIGSAITGIAIYKPAQFNYLVWLCGGYHLTRVLHFALTLGYVFFFVIHIVQVTLAGWKNFSSAVTGFEVIDDNSKPTIKKPMTRKKLSSRLPYSKK
ncbi:cytochrome b/b6 domain-containing protein [Mucilaginibacter antarcticus]|uniref:cytochrome b/b6 domain-containing protein n=1 Tax=Mucilaginibacter antarcticus TaxID=1855725 RepID=UPI003629CF6B